MNIYNRDDRVVYAGRKFTGELSGQVGFIVAPVDKDPGVWVVDFSGDSYVISENFLNKYKPSAKDEGAPEVHTRRRRKHEDE
jgi:hypothetical protein